MLHAILHEMQLPGTLGSKPAQKCWPLKANKPPNSKNKLPLNKTILLHSRLREKNMNIKILKNRPDMQS